MNVLCGGNIYFLYRGSIIPSENFQPATLSQRKLTINN